MFSSLKVREFRLYWVTMFLSLVGTWVQSIAQSWLVFKLTQSPFLLGFVGFLGALPVALFSLAAGVVVDRAVKRNILIVTQAALMFLALILAILVQKGMIQVWHIMVIAVLNGIVFSVDAPVRQSMVVDLAGKQHLFNAITLNSAAFNLARLIGPAIAGVLIAVIGMAGCFYINAASFIPLLIALFFINPVPPAIKEKTVSFRGEVGEAISFLWANKKLLVLLGVVAIFSMFGVAYIILMPIFAQDILAQGSKGFAVLMSMNGAGALAGVLNLARLKHLVAKQSILRACVIIFCVSLMTFALSGSFVLSSFMLFLAGFGCSSSLSLVNTLFQVSIPDNYRGRLMGVYCMMFMGLLPFGYIFAGLFAQLWNVQAVVFCGALLSLFFYFIVYESRFVKRHEDFQY